MSNMQTMVTLNADKLKSEIRKNMRVGLNTMVWGGPGIGKSEVPEQIAKEMGIPIMDFRANLFDP